MSERESSRASRKGKKPREPAGRRHSDDDKAKILKLAERFGVEKESKGIEVRVRDRYAKGS